MPHTLSAKKRIRQTEKRRVYNKSAQSEIKTRSKRFLAAVAQNDAEAAQSLLRVVLSRIGKARKNKILHPNKAARLESRLTRILHRMGNA
jgi:small subunit ribosomal protein S20